MKPVSDVIAVLDHALGFVGLLNYYDSDNVGLEDVISFLFPGDTINSFSPLNAKPRSAINLVTLNACSTTDFPYSSI